MLNTIIVNKVVYHRTKEHVLLFLLFLLHLNAKQLNGVPIGSKHDSWTMINVELLNHDGLKGTCSSESSTISYGP